MKHLKTFESIDNKFYFKISPYLRSMYLGLIPGEREKIVYMSRGSISLINKHNIPGHNSFHHSNKPGTHKPLRYYTTDTGKIGTIVELEDEWFLVEILGNKKDEFDSYKIYYLCDQLEGLDKYLIDNFDTKKRIFKIK